MAVLKPRIYVACLASLHEGSEYGAWIEVEGDAWQLWTRVRDMLLTSPAANADAFAVQDFEGFGAVNIAPTTGLDVIAELARQQTP